MKTDLAKPFSYWKLLDHEMLKLTALYSNVISESKYSLNTLFLVIILDLQFILQIYRSITFHRSNIWSVLK